MILPSLTGRQGGSPSRLKAGSALLVAGGVLAAGTVLGAAGGPATASSHREAPLTAADPAIDNTDVYAFVSPDKPNSVTLLANWIPFEEPNGGPNFYPWSADARYDINIDNNGDGKADLIYRWTFKNQDKRGISTFLYNNGPVTSLDDANLLFRQTYTLQLIKGSSTTTIATGVSAPSDVGPASMPDYAALRAASVAPVAGGGKTFAGQSDDPFFLDLRVFDLLYGANLKESGHDTLAGYNVNSIGLQLPKSAFALKGNATGNPVIGVWSTTSRRTLQLSAGKGTPSGAYVQVSRLGNPLVNEVVVPAGLKDAFNSLTPDKDHTIGAVVNRVTDPELPKLIQAIYGVPAPKTPRNDIAEIFLTGITTKAGGPIKADLNSQLLNKDVPAKSFVPSEMLRLNMAIAPASAPNRLGVLAKDLQGFPNGRRLTDDVLDIEIQALEGAAQTGVIVPALAAGDGVNANDHAFGSVFPYLALPNTAAVNQAAAGGTTPAGGVETGRSGEDPNKGGFPVVPAATGLGALVLLGTGVVMVRHRPSKRSGLSVK